MNKVRWGVLGLGNIGQTFCNSIQPVGNATLQAVASKSKNIDSIHTPKDIPAKYVFTNYSDLLACDQVDAIYIALPNHLHMEWILRSLEHGKHVLVEKPAVIYPDDLLKLKKDFAGKNLIFAEAFMYLHHPRIEMLLNYIEEGKIGKPLRMKSSWGFEIFRKTSPLKKLLHFYKPKPSRFRMNHGGGCILDLGCYMTSLSYIISRIFSKTEGFCFSIEDKKYTYSNEEVELDASATIKFSNGFFSEVHCSFTSNLDENTWIFGEEGKIRLKDTWSCQTNGFWINSEFHETPKPCFDNPYSFQINKISEVISAKNMGKATSLRFGLNESFCNARILDSWRTADLLKQSPAVSKI